MLADLIYKIKIGDFDSSDEEQKGKTSGKELTIAAIDTNDENILRFIQQILLP